VTAYAPAGLPLIATEPVPACPVCGATDREPAGAGPDYESRTSANEWRFVGCRPCGHVWLDPRPAVSTLGVIYPPDYYAYVYDEVVSPIAVRGKQWLDARKLAGILRVLPRPPRSFLDVGCGEGRFLELMERRGVARSACHGIELDEDTVARLRERGYPVQRGRVEDAEVPDGSLDLVTMFHVVEHVEDPGAVVERIAGWLRPGGVLALETPNVASLDRRLFARGFWGGYHFPRHWNLFTPATLRRLLEDRGLEVVDLRFQTGHAFWMLSCHHALRYGRRPMPRLARLFDPFGGFLPFLVAFTALDKLRAALGRPTSAMLVLARRPPATLVA
jgi:SAM-dependent methyltransferase